MKYPYIIIVLFFLFCGVDSFAEQPVFEVDDPAISENFREIYLRMDQHRHAGDDNSNRMFDVIPDSSTTYDLGSPTRTWASSHIATGTFTAALQISTYSTTQLNTWTPPRIGIVVLNVSIFDLCVSTIQAQNGWKNTRTGDGCN